MSSKLMSLYWHLVLNGCSRCDVIDLNGRKILKKRAGGSISKKLRGLKFTSEKMRGLKILLKYLRGLKNLRHL